MADVNDIGGTVPGEIKSSARETGDCPSPGQASVEGPRIKGILKHPSETEKDSPPPKTPNPEKTTKWDEMNILETYHPANKDYGHLKICEPPTPYHRLSISDENETLDEATIAASLEAVCTVSEDERFGEARGDNDDFDDDDDDSILTEAEKARREEFRSRRKMHYNEFQAAKLARELLKRDEEELERLEKESGNG